jgi:phosphohistidine swiveling domain-containing protein
MDTALIWNLQDKRLPSSIGNKAQNLRTLSRLGYRVPLTYVITWEAYEAYVQNDVSLIERLRQELTRILLPTQRYAVRSSANIEDQLGQSFAGQFKSVLDVQGVDQVLQSTWSIWATAHSARVHDYLTQTANGQLELKMAVLVQEMVNPVLSGVSFSKNPLTGLHEVVVEAVKGSGEALVQSGSTPFRWVYKWGAWSEQPDQPPVDIHTIQEIVQQTQRISSSLKKNVDLEWVFDGEVVTWVQVREITSIKDLNVYSNRISREMLPGMIKPLVWSINIPTVNQVWIDILTELIGPNGLKPEDLAKAFYYRTYFNMGKFGQIFNSLGLPAESLEMMMGLMPAGHRARMKMSMRTMTHTPRMLRFILNKARLSRQLDAFIPKMWENFRAFPLEEARHLGENNLLLKIELLRRLTQQTAYYNILAPLVMFLSNAILRRQLKSTSVRYEELDLLRGLDEIQDHSPGHHLEELHRSFRALPAPIQAQVAAQGLPGLENLAEQNGPAASFLAAFDAFMGKFGHLSDSGNDFSSVPWRECPESILQLVLEFPAPKEQSEAMVAFDDVRLPSWKKFMLSRVYEHARQYRLYREKISSLYTYGYGLFRVYFLALGELLTRRGILAEAEDIFYLSFQEVLDTLTGRQLEKDPLLLVIRRKTEMEEMRNIVTPETIFGDQPPPVYTGISQRLVGTPTSRGYYTGPISVVRSLQDFGKMKTGAVLVIPYSDVGWTPLFTKAGGVISESGGMLSHSSIIAREYGIPAVVSVPNATQLPDGAMVSVDGFRGEIFLHEPESNQSPPL